MFEKKKLPTKTEVFKEGEEAVGFYLIKKGSIKLYKDVV